MPFDPSPTRLDHLVYAVTDLDAAVDDLAERLGARPSAGGRHVGRGTRNFLLSFGDGSYLEIIGVDDGQPSPQGPRPFGIDLLTGPRLVTWAVRVDDIDDAVGSARRHGYDPGPAQAMSRATPDGGLLSWQLTDALLTADGLVPFLIAWGDTVHPSLTATGGARLMELTAEHPEPALVATAFAALGVAGVTVERGPQARLVARIDGPGGSVRLT